MAAARPATVCTVSTVKDTPENLRRFVDGNLRAGADHMFLFLDQPDADVVAALADDPHVTVVPTGPEYWQGRRPSLLVDRQHVNANVANTVLAAVPTVRWLMHLDGDECLHLDRDRLLGLPVEVRAVRLTAWEAVSRPHWDGPVTRYKRPLDDDELCLLFMLGVVERPSMRSYFRGHLKKSGVRPGLDLHMAVHRVEHLDGSPVEHTGADWLCLLHDESYSGEEFVRKWSAKVTNPRGRQLAGRDRLRAAITSLRSNPALGDDDRRQLLDELYERVVRDREDVLERLGYLERPDPAWHGHHPSRFTNEDAEAVAGLLRLVHPTDKAYFDREAPRPPRELFEQLHRGLGLRPHPLKRRLRTALGG